jgi:hypothetical protein
MISSRVRSASHDGVCADLVWTGPVLAKRYRGSRGLKVAHQLDAVAARASERGF